MLNTTIIKQEGERLVPYEKTVTEIKAPTDSSIRLLNEFKEKILKDTLLVFKVSNTDIEAVFRYVQFAHTLERKAVVKFQINNTEYVEEIIIDDVLSMSAREEQIIDYLIDQWKKIVVNCVNSITREVLINFIQKGRGK